MHVIHTVQYSLMSLKDILLIVYLARSFTLYMYIDRYLNLITYLPADITTTPRPFIVPSLSAVTELFINSDDEVTHVTADTRMVKNNMISSNHSIA